MSASPAEQHGGASLCGATARGRSVGVTHGRGTVAGSIGARRSNYARRKPRSIFQSAGRVQLTRAGFARRHAPLIGREGNHLNDCPFT